MNPFEIMRDGFIITSWMWGLFSIKHWLADYLFQTDWMVRNKGRYFSLGGWVHALIHGTGSIPIWVVLFWMVPMEIGPGRILGWIGFAFGIEVLLRHMNDYLETNLIQRASGPWYWRLIGFNQLADSLIYVGLGMYWWSLIWSEFPHMNLKMAGLTP